MAVFEIGEIIPTDHGSARIIQILHRDADDSTRSDVRADERCSGVTVLATTCLDCYDSKKQLKPGIKTFEYYYNPA